MERTVKRGGFRPGAAEGASDGPPDACLELFLEPDGGRPCVVRLYAAAGAGRSFYGRLGGVAVYGVSEYLDAREYAAESESARPATVPGLRIFRP